MAFDAFGTVSFATQGAAQNETDRSEHQGKFEVISFNWGILCPKDPQRGVPTGSRQHQPIQFTKNWGASTPQFFQAACNNEHLNASFEFWRTTPEGVPEKYMTIAAERGSVASIKYGTGSGFGAEDSSTSRGRGQYDQMETETISITFERVIITHNVAGVEAVDDWRTMI